MGSRYSRNQMIISTLLEHEMHMTRPPGMPLQLNQQLPHRPVMGDRIRDWHNGLEPKDAVPIATHHTTSIWPIMIWLLDVVMSRGISLPDINLAALNRLAVYILQRAKDKQWLPSFVMRNLRAVGEVFGFVSMKWTKDRAIR